MNKYCRRNVLKGLALVFPAAWSSPIVQSVVLPAHAQTSTGCEFPLVIDDIQVGCGTSDTKRYYYVDDTAECPIVVPIPGSEPAPGDAEVITFELLGGGTQIAVRLITGGDSEVTGNLRALEIQNCDDQPFVSAVTHVGPWTISARSGAKYSLVVTRVRNVDSVAFTDIELSPL